MCKPTKNSTATGKSQCLKRDSSRLLLTHDSFIADTPDKDDENKRSLQNPFRDGLGGPNRSSILLTVSFYVGVLAVLEQMTRRIILQFVHVDPILAVERNRHILSRHIAVDFISCLTVGYLGFTNRHVCRDLIRQGSSFGRSNTMKEDEFENRIFNYHPASQRLLMMFFAYQTKNMFDTIYWNDGPEFVIHHIFAGAAAWGGMFPGCCHFYALFYMGVSEISTAILCLLANFDDQYGVAGLDQVFPKTKLVLGALFVISFIICRVIMWPYVTYHFGRDTLKAIRSDAARAEGRRGYLWVIFYCCAGLSVIQVVFLAQIIITGKEELAKMMD